MAQYQGMDWREVMRAQTILSTSDDLISAEMIVRSLISYINGLFTRLEDGFKINCGSEFNITCSDKYVLFLVRMNGYLSTA